MTYKASDLSLSSISTKSLQNLSKKTIFFGHQSVGFNIIDGIERVLKNDGRISIPIMESTNAKDFSPPVFLHFRAGVNTKPESKIKAFENAIKSGIGDLIDIAFLKFCYIDFDLSTNVGALFSTYQKTIASLQTNYPDIEFIHFTAPLTTIQKGPKAWVKKILGRAPYGVQENIKKQEYNELLRKTYSGKEPIFDIAKIESTTPNGSRITKENNGEIYYALNPDITNDGGHLNETGSALVAAELLKMLSEIDPQE
ncbi:MAG: hypothetical protein HN368_19670 [Spirochaetales bacterium]|jgi:hypothetical protein|nr:hypothetical protein [Spirochaetales bacterium]